MLLKNPKSILGFDDRKYALFGIILNTQTVMAIYYTGSFFKVKSIDYLVNWLGEFFVILILWTSIRAMYLQIAKRFRGFNRIRKRLLVLPFFIIPYFIICFSYLKYIQPFFQWDYSVFPEPGIPVRLATGAIILYANMIFYEALLLITEMTYLKIKEERRKKENLSSQLISLKSQLSPHFFFNCLNTLIYLIDIDKERSKEFVHKLSQVYKFSLENSSQDLVSLRQELEAIKPYVGLLKERYGNNVAFNMEILEIDKEKTIVPFTLLIGIENALKHNVITKRNPLKISLFSENDYLVIKNNLQKRQGKLKDFGSGLKNIIKRYTLITKREVLIKDKGANFELYLPLLNNKI